MDKKRKREKINYRKLAGEESNVNVHIGKIVNNDFDEYDEFVIRVVKDGRSVTSESFRKEGLDTPIIIKDKADSIGMVVPKNKLTLWNIANEIGYAHPISMIDVTTQEEIPPWTMSCLVSYFQRRKSMRRKGISGDDRILNQISLEFSKTKLMRHFVSPRFVRELDWIENAWPNDRKVKDEYPRVQYYCLTSTEGCYTDFHIDFGGTSIWYNIHSGMKIFLLIPPTPQNLNHYESWICSETQQTQFFADLVDKCYKVSLNENETIIIPSGWIHAVYTPQDSISVGGNFLHSLNVKMQLQIHKLETRIKINQKFRFPFFIHMMFYAGAYLLSQLQQNALTNIEIDNLQILVEALSQWNVAPGGDALYKGSFQEAAQYTASLSGFQTYSELLDHLVLILMKHQAARQSNTPFSEIVSNGIEHQKKDILLDGTTENADNDNKNLGIRLKRIKSKKSKVGSVRDRLKKRLSM